LRLWICQTVSKCGCVFSPFNIHLHQTLLLGLDALKEWWVGELELVVLSGRKAVVSLGLGHLLDKGFEVSTVSPQLEAVKVESIGDGVVQEARVVRDDDCNLKLGHERLQ
jgi:hypothetical protein